ncbi:MAG: fasciclin domain-containing protein [Oceanipulchritudo sp.]
MKKHILATLSILALAVGLSAQPLAPAISDATENEDGSYSNWFGTFTPEDSSLSNEGWIAHTEHGRLYLNAVGQNLWLYDPNVAALGEPFNGWIYTNRNTFPYFFVRNSPPTFLLYISGVEGPEPTPRVFLNTRTFETIFLPKVTPETVVDIAAGNPDFSSLVTALTTAGLVEPLSGEGPFTVFAPTNEAFEQLDPDTLNDLLTNEESLPALTDILTYHVVPGRLTSGDLGLDLGSILRGESLSGFATTLGGSDLRIDVTPFGILLDGSTMVTTADIEGSNGVIHVIDSVLIPPADIVDTATEAGFSTLVAAVQAAGLEDALRGDGPFTVFAPTDEAFAALGEETLNSLLDDPETLADILLYHVVDSDIYASEVAPGQVEMFNGDPATIALTDTGVLTIEDANIIATDVVSSNGVIHVIDTVILPPAE